MSDTSVPSPTVPSASSPSGPSGPVRSIAGVVEALSGRGEGVAGSGSAAIVPHDRPGGTTPRVVVAPTLPELATAMVLLPDATEWAEPDSCDRLVEAGSRSESDDEPVAEPDAFPRWLGPNGAGSWLVQPYGDPMYVESINLPACPTVAQALDIAAAQIACALWIAERRG